MGQGSSGYTIVSNVIEGLYSGSVETFFNVDVSGSLFIIPVGAPSVLNSSTSSLSSGSTFTGIGEQNFYPDVLVSCKTDAPGVLYFDFSNDNTNWDTFPTNGFTISSGIHEFHNAVKGPRYFRVRLVSSENQNYLRLYTYYGTYKQANLPLNQSITGDADAITTRGVIVGSTDGGTYRNVPVTNEGHLEVAIHSPRLPFNSLHVEKLTPIFQTDAVYGLNVGQVSTGATLSGNVYTSQSMFVCETGTTMYSQAYLQSRKRLRYRPGQGMVPRFTAKFSPPVQGSYQLVGVGHAEDGFYIGCSGSSFGILHSSFGVREQQVLNITTPSSTNQNVIVTLAGVTSSIAVTNANNANRMAWELSQGTYSGWDAEPSGSSVLFTAQSVGNKTGVFNLSGSAGVTGSFSELQAGAPATETFVSQSEWNGDKLNGSGSSGVTLDPFTGNVYQMGIQYLGFGPSAVYSEVKNGNNDPDFVLLHSFNFPNARTIPTYGNPSFPFLMAASSAGSTSNIKVSVASFGGFIEGDKYLTGNSYSYRNTLNSVSTTLYSALFTVRNSRRFGNRTNQSVVNILSLGYACRLSTNAAGEYFIIKGGNLVGTPVFNPYDTWSCTTFDTGSTSVTFNSNNQILFSIPVSETGNGIIQIPENIPIDLQPGEWITVAMKLQTGTATYANATLNTIEDQ